MNSFYKVRGGKDWLVKVYPKKLRDKRSSRWRKWVTEPKALMRMNKTKKQKVLLNLVSRFP